MLLHHRCFRSLSAQRLESVDRCAQVSELHCNFLINLGAATAADIENLGETVRKRVKDNSGVDLDWEIKRIGVAA